MCTRGYSIYVGPHLLANTQGGPPPRRGAQREMRLPKTAVGPVAEEKVEVSKR
jgi:hypothetical protein